MKVSRIRIFDQIVEAKWGEIMGKKDKKLKKRSARILFLMNLLEVPSSCRLPSGAYFCANEHSLYRSLSVNEVQTLLMNHLITPGVPLHLKTHPFTSLEASSHHSSILPGEVLKIICEIKEYLILFD
jgi:hypothetical protein